MQQSGELTGVTFAHKLVAHGSCSLPDCPCEQTETQNCGNMEKRRLRTAEDSGGGWPQGRRAKKVQLEMQQSLKKSFLNSIL